jgi:hypothetical protein
MHIFQELLYCIYGAVPHWEFTVVWQISSFSSSEQLSEDLPWVPGQDSVAYLAAGRRATNVATLQTHYLATPHPA